MIAIRVGTHRPLVSAERRTEEPPQAGLGSIRRALLPSGALRFAALDHLVLWQRFVAGSGSQPAFRGIDAGEGGLLAADVRRIEGVTAATGRLR